MNMARDWSPSGRAKNLGAASGRHLANSIAPDLSHAVRVATSKGR